MQVLCKSGVEVDAFMYSSADGLVMEIFGGRYRMGDKIIWRRNCKMFIRLLVAMGFVPASF